MDNQILIGFIHIIHPNRLSIVPKKCVSDTEVSGLDPPTTGRCVLVMNWNISCHGAIGQMIARDDPERVIAGRLDLVTPDYNRDEITAISMDKRLDHVSEDPFSRFTIVCVNLFAGTDLLDRTETNLSSNQRARDEASSPQRDGLEILERG